jgi:hypothetical protein
MPSCAPRQCRKSPPYAQFLADLNGITGQPPVSLTQTAEVNCLKHMRWQAADGHTEVGW